MICKLSNFSYTHALSSLISSTMSYMLTLKKPCAFAALVSPSNHHQSISPPPNINTGVNITPLHSSSGMFLLIWNILPDMSTGFINPVKAVQQAADEIIVSQDMSELLEIPIEVTQGGRLQDLHSTSMYIDLSSVIKAMDTVPRPDLLSDWMVMFTNHCPQWDVVWAPQKKGKDWRMIVCFHIGETKEKVPTYTVEKIHKHLDSKGHCSVGGYISYGGLVDIALADTPSVDAIVSTQYYVIPSLSPDTRHVSCPRIIAIQNAFELCISGLSDYEGLNETIEKWLYYQYAYQDHPMQSTHVFVTCVSPC